MSRVLGVKIAQRLLEGVPPHPSASSETTDEQDERIWIILACRSRQRAQAAEQKLRGLFPSRTLLLTIENLDLCSMRNVEDFCTRLLHR
jgi:hypothetical protein